MIWCLFRCLVLLFRSSLDWFNQEDAAASVWKRVFYCFASIKPLSASRRSFQQMLLSNVPWMAPDRMALMKNYTNKQIKLKWTAAPFNNFFKYWQEWMIHGCNVCLCRIIMNACNKTTLFVPSCTLHWFTWYKKIRWKYRESTGCR